MHRVNYSDKRGLRHGYWISYYDSANTQIWSKNKFRHGKNCGTSYYYFPQGGHLQRKEKYLTGKRMRVWLYYPNGQLKMKGKARQEETKEMVHFYFTGAWKIYSDSGVLLRTHYYEKGKIQKVDYHAHRHNDSLKHFLETLDRQFQEADRILTDSINRAKSPEQKRYFRQRKTEADSIVFNELIRYLLYNGYPSKKEVDDAAVIPFYILSFAPVVYRDVALPYFEEAAKKQDIELKSLAFFIDKLRIAKKEKQLYGTQFYYEGDKVKYYPVEKPEGLEERRKQMGLD